MFSFEPGSRIDLACPQAKESPERLPADHNAVWYEVHNISLERYAENIRQSHQSLCRSRGIQHLFYGSEEDPDRHKRDGHVVWLTGWLHSIQREWVGVESESSDPSNNGDEIAWYVCNNKMYQFYTDYNFSNIENILRPS